MLSLLAAPAWPSCPPHGGLAAAGPTGVAEDAEEQAALRAGWTALKLGPRILRTETAASGRRRRHAATLGRPLTITSYPHVSHSLRATQVDSTIPCPRRARWVSPASACWSEPSRILHKEYHHARITTLPSAASMDRPAWLGLAADGFHLFANNPLTTLLFGLVYCIVLLFSVASPGVGSAGGVLGPLLTRAASGSGRAADTAQKNPGWPKLFAAFRQPGWQSPLGIGLWYLVMLMPVVFWSPCWRWYAGPGALAGSLQAEPISQDIHGSAC